MSENKLDYGISICGLCLIDTGEYYMLPNKEWISIVPEKHQKKHLCMKCYNFFRKQKGLLPLKYEDWEIITKPAVNQGVPNE